MKKILVSGIIAAVAMFVATVALGMLFNMLFPTLKTEYQNTFIFRSGNDSVMYIYILQPFLLAFALAWLWKRTKSIFKNNVWKTALYFSLIYWIVAVIPGLIMSVSTFKISILMTLTWTLSSLFQVWIAMLIIIKMNRY